ncbi:hypothetical protein Bca52824_026525 [Brassica carinata]|uniref:Uncharacterized protein n=1 Tax=Brassica carinata TaxID=52824 RepID=A0A8X7SIR0_BRACI|nr:hypothetical protein Bca52824_026525 [Brassica carinata]
MTKTSESCEVEEITMNSPPWPPVASPGQTYREEGPNFGSSEWVDKVMVSNRQDEMRRVESLWGGGTADNGISMSSTTSTLEPRPKKPVSKPIRSPQF